MKTSIPIYLVVGFLGSGKTTLLKRLVHATEGCGFLFVVNEFSAVDVDAGQIEREGGAAIAVAGGSIFCRCLITEFVAVMRRISGGVRVGEELVRPGGVVIEASGMADPRSAARLLSESGLDRSFHVAGVTAVVDPGVLMKLLLVLPNIRGQIQCADLILFNKIDLHSAATIEKVAVKVRSFNPGARVVHCTHCDIDPALVLGGTAAAAVRLTDAEYNKCRDPHFEREALEFRAKPALEELAGLFAGKLEGLYRAKGCIECAEGWMLVEWSEGGLSHAPAGKQEKSVLSLIWDPGNEPEIIAKLRYLAM